MTPAERIAQIRKRLKNSDPVIERNRNGMWVKNPHQVIYSVGDCKDDMYFLLSRIEKLERVADAGRAMAGHFTPRDLAWGHESMEQLTFALAALDESGER